MNRARALAAIPRILATIDAVSIPRAVCLRCHKAAVTCVCARIPRVDNRTEVLVLQHPRERQHPIGTARFASLGLQRARVEIAWRAGLRETEPPAWLPPGTALLYPGKHARELRELPSAERPAHLLVIDGTWNTARTLYRDKLWLQALPQYRFQPAAPGNYRIRREPQADYVSTIEAIVEALQILEPDTPGLDALLGAFTSMIDQQLDYIERGGGGFRGRKRRRDPAQLRTPHALVERFERLVIVYGEPSRPGGDLPREFVHFGALALQSGERFERLMLPATGLPDPCHLEHMRLTHDDFAGALDRSGFAREFAAFLERAAAKPIFAAWNQRTLDLLARSTGTPVSHLSLKSAYRSVYGRDERDLDAVVRALGLTPLPTGMRGRTAHRLGCAGTVARFLHERTLPEPLAPRPSHACGD